MHKWNNPQNFKKNIYCSIALRIIFSARMYTWTNLLVHQNVKINVKNHPNQAVFPWLGPFVQKSYTNAIGLSHLFETHIQKRFHVYNLFCPSLLSSLITLTMNIK